MEDPHAIASSIGDKSPLTYPHAWTGCRGPSFTGWSLWVSALCGFLDGLEVTIVGSMSEALKPADTGLGLSNFDIGLAGAVYVAGGCRRTSRSARSSH